MIYLYRQPLTDEQFVIAGDPAEGGDNSTFIVLSKFKADVVMVGQSKEESSQLGHTLNRVGSWFKNKTNLYPSIGIEKNTGSATIYVLKTLNYPNLFRMPNSFTKDGDESSDQFGWSTNIATRPKMLDDLAMAIRQKAINIPSKPVVDELYSFVRDIKTGKPQADRGSNDDLVMALAIAWQMFQIVPREDNSDILDLPDERDKFMGGFY